MNSINNLLMTDAARSSKNGDSTISILPLPKTSALDGSLPNRVLLAAVLILVAAFVWACWNFVHVLQSQPTKLLLAVIGSLAVCLLALAAAMGAVFWSRHVAAESE